MVDTSPRTIGIDCRLSGNAHAGIGRYIEELIIRLPLVDTKTTWVFFFFSKKQATELLEKFKQRPKNIRIVLAPVKHYSIKEQLVLPTLFQKEKLDILHVPHFNVPLFYKGTVVVTIHDLLWHEFRGLQVTTLKPYQYYLKYLAYRVITGLAIKKAHKIMVPAQTIRKIVARYYPWAKQKIVVTKEGHSQTFKPSQSKLQRTKTFLYVGSLYPHKNISVILKALKSLPDYSLDIVGSRNIFQEQTRTIVEQLGVSSQVQFLGYLDDSELNKKLNQACALVQPSLSEGFGLTGIEAMAAGTPVIASDIPIFKEIYQDGALFFDPEYATDFVRTITTMGESDLETIIQKGKKVAQQYSWDTMTKETLNVYFS
jgi:glycosyltransferase involved in cell wall biosynthesis